MPRTSQLRAIVVPLTLVVLLPGCGEQSLDARPSQVSDSAGVRTVHVEAARLGLEAPIRVAPEPHLRVGALDGSEGDLLTAPTAARRLSDGRLLVIESGPRRARLMDPEGGFLRWIGGIGEGPSEYQQLSGGGTLEGDSIWLHDRARNRILVFTPEGEFARAVAYDRPGGGAQIRFVRVLSGGSIVDVATTMGGEALSRAAGGTFHERILLHTVGATGEEVELVADLPGDEWAMQMVELPSGQQAATIRNTSPTFALPHQMEVGPEGRVWIGAREGFELHRLDLRGELLEVIRVDAPPTPVTASVIAEYEALHLENVPPEVRDGVAAGFADREYAETLPLFQRLAVDETGLLWVSEYVGHRPGATPRVWWIVEPAGDLLGRVEVPEGFRVLHIGADEILGVVQDEWEVPYVVGHALER